jgi:hypothetical protein
MLCNSLTINNPPSVQLKRTIDVTAVVKPVLLDHETGAVHSTITAHMDRGACALYVRCRTDAMVRCTCKVHTQRTPCIHHEPYTGPGNGTQIQPKRGDNPMGDHSECPSVCRHNLVRNR